MKRRERKTVEQKIRNAQEWLYEVAALAEKALSDSTLPSFNPSQWDGVAYKIKLARLVLGKAQSHARRLARRGLSKKGLR